MSASTLFCSPPSARTRSHTRTAPDAPLRNTGLPRTPSAHMHAARNLSAVLSQVSLDEESNTRRELVCVSFLHNGQHTANTRFLLLVDGRLPTGPSSELALAASAFFLHASHKPACSEEWKARVAGFGYDVYLSCECQSTMVLCKVAPESSPPITTTRMQVHMHSRGTKTDTVLDVRTPVGAELDDEGSTLAVAASDLSKETEHYRYNPSRADPDSEAVLCSGDMFSAYSPSHDIYMRCRCDAAALFASKLSSE